MQDKFILEAENGYRTTFLSKEDELAFEQYRSCQEVFIKLADEVISLVNQGRTGEARELAYGKMIEQVSVVNKELEALLTLNIDAAHNVSNGNTALANRTALIRIAHAPEIPARAELPPPKPERKPDRPVRRLSVMSILRNSDR